MADNLKTLDLLQKQYPELGISKLDIDDAKGTSTFYMKPTKDLPFLDGKSSISPISYRKEVSSTLRRSPLDRSYVDLVNKTSPFNTSPKDLFNKAMIYYKENPTVGAAVNLLVFLASKGFENDIDDDEIKKFYDVWCHDVKFKKVLSWIFTDLIKLGHVFTYKTVAPYTKRESKLSPIPGVSLGQIADKKLDDLTNKILGEVMAELKAKGLGLSKGVLKNAETAASKKVKKATQIPVAYTVLNPVSIDIEGSMFFDSVSITMNAPDDIKSLLKKTSSELNDSEKELIKLLPSDFKKQIQESGKVVLDKDLVGQVTYMKQPYERYASPRMTRVFDSLEYKQALINADLSTLDGISNYILKITVGNDEHPVTDQSQLETVAKLFQTNSKSFDVVWNHTLKVEKIVSPEIEAILGKEKYEQVNDDISAGVAVIRALIDGKGTEVSTAQLGLLLKGMAEEINYIRSVVTEWIYNEYALIAEVVGFDRFPRIRWDESILKDTILYMTVISQLVDRRMLSYRTAHETLGFDYSTELNNMTKEIDLVKNGTFGLRGSPWQQTTNTDVQPVQEAPKGTPSSGRPTAQPSKTKNTPALDDATKASLKALKNLSDDEFDVFIEELSNFRKGG